MGSDLITAISLSGPAARDTIEAPPVVTDRRASEDAVRLALRLRGCRSPAGGPVLVFVPVSAGESAARLVYEAALALDELQDGPLLVLDLRRESADAEPLFAEWPLARAYHANGDSGDALDAAAAVSRLAFAQPIAKGAAVVPFVTSPEFGALLASARSHYAYVLCIAAPVTDAIEALVAASLSDGVVLSVRADRTTMTEVHDAQRQFGRVQAPMLGFVVDRGPRRVR